MKKYKFRAECSTDVSRFRDVIKGTDVVIDAETREKSHLPDVIVDIHTRMDETAIIRLMKRVPDSHVMIRTLEPS